MNRQIVYIGVITKEGQPLDLQDFRSNKEISMSFVVYSCLDIVERKIKELAETREYSQNYLGYLGPALLGEGDYALYGWVSFTGVKFIVVILENYEQRNDEKIKAFLQNIENLYQRTMSNPFYSSHDFSSSSFLKKLQKQISNL